jgi:hypothetical protein
LLPQRHPQSKKLGHDLPDVEGGRLLVMASILLAPLVVAGYVGLTLLFFLPLLGFRMVFRRPIASRSGPRSLAAVSA